MTFTIRLNPHPPLLIRWLVYNDGLTGECGDKAYPKSSIIKTTMEN